MCSNLYVTSVCIILYAYVDFGKSVGAAVVFMLAVVLFYDMGRHAECDFSVFQGCVNDHGCV